MALLLMDGFDTYGAAGANIVLPLEYAGYTTYESFNADSGAYASADTRTGVGTSLGAVGRAYVGGVIRNFPTTAGVVIGLAVKMNVPSFAHVLAIGYNNYVGGTFNQLVMFANGANGITLQTGDGNHTYASAPNVLFEGVWQYVEIKYSPGIGTSYLEVRVDGVTVISATNEALQTTGAAALVNFITIMGEGGASSLVDDLYVLDLTGTTFNDFLGDVVVHPLYPISDGGTNTFTQVGGTAGEHFSTVDDVTPDGDTSYVWANTTGQKENYGLSTIPSDVVDVIAVSVNVLARKEAPGVGFYKSFISVGGVEVDSPQFSAPIVYAQTSFIMETQPGGAAWTNSAAQGALIGFKIP